MRGGVTRQVCVTQLQRHADARLRIHPADILRRPITKVCGERAHDASIRPGRFFYSLDAFGATITAMLAVLLACALLAQQTESIRSVFELSGEVDRIDRTGRTISLRSTGVVDAPIYVGPDLPIFNELKSGDIVTVRYFDSYIVAVTPGERMTAVENTTAEAQEATVTQPDGTVLRQARVVVTIDAIDIGHGNGHLPRLRQPQGVSRGAGSAVARGREGGRRRHHPLHARAGCDDHEAIGGLLRRVERHQLELLHALEVLVERPDEATNLIGQ